MGRILFYHIKKRLHIYLIIFFCALEFVTERISSVIGGAIVLHCNRISYIHRFIDQYPKQVFMSESSSFQALTQGSVRLNTMRRREVKPHFVLLLRIRLKPRSNGHKPGHDTETRSDAVQISIEYNIVIKVIIKR